jgi:hypothetical protein
MFIAFLFTLVTLVFGQVEVQHCKPTTVSKVITRTRVQTVMKTVTLRGTASPVTSQKLKTVTKTVSASGSPVTVCFHPVLNLTSNPVGTSCWNEHVCG